MNISHRKSPPSPSQCKIFSSHHKTDQLNEPNAKSNNKKRGKKRRQQHAHLHHRLGSGIKGPPQSLHTVTAITPANGDKGPARQRAGDGAYLGQLLMGNDME
jgi:hypothetical protein